MYKTIEGVYEDGKITLKEDCDIKKAKVIVTFLEEEELKIFKEVPDIFKNPIKVDKFLKFNRSELHER